MVEDTRMRDCAGCGTSGSEVRRAELTQRVLEAAPVVILLLDGQGAIQYANPHFERMTGYRLDEIQGKDWFETFLPVRDRERIRAVFRRSYGGESVRGNVNPIVTRTGEERDIEWTDEQLRDPEGRPTGLLAIGHDVTERKAAQDALRTSEQRLAEAQVIASLGAWRLDLQTWTRWWSEEQYRITGVPCGTPVTQELFMSLIHPDDRSMFQQGFDRALAEGAAEFEFRVVRPSREVREVYGRARTTYDADGKAVIMSGTAQDITERKRAEEAARRASELLRTVVATAPIVLFAMDRDGVLTLLEGRALESFGLKPGEIVGGSASEVFADVPGFTDAVRRSLAGERTVLAFNVGPVELETVLIPSIDARGRIDGVTGVSFDVTERKCAEVQLRGSIAEQQRLVEELRTADRHKNDFIAVMSHELRNPVAAIQNGLHVLGRASPGGEQSTRAVAIIERQVAQLARLVDDLLDLSRISQNKIQLHRAPVDLDQLVQTATDDYRPLFTSRGVRLEATLAGEPVVVNGDAARLTQVIGNLLHNAVKFTPSGGLTTISLARDAVAGRAVLRVSDTGAGIDPAMIDQMFRPFTQADRTLARSMGGLGLGLTLVKELVELHGGDVSVSSEGEGRGAEFVVRVPLHQRPEHEAIASPSKVVWREPRRVLVVEDNVDAADTLRTLLEFEGHAVEVAYDGLAGIRSARAFRPDVVLCDLGLPGVNGYEVARELSCDDALRSTRLVALSGYATPEDVARAREAGFDEHLAKPVPLDRLRGVLAG
jgi:PAS domain S-box-containing protein